MLALNHTRQLVYKFSLDYYGYHITGKVTEQLSYQFWMLEYTYSNSIKRHREAITLAVDALVWYYMNSKGH